MVHYTKTYDYLWENEKLSLLGVNLLAHIQRREQGSLKACTESAGHMAKWLHVSLNSLKREVDKLAREGYITKEVIRGVGWKLKTLSISEPIQSQPIQSQPIQSQPIQSQPIQSQQQPPTGSIVNPYRVNSEPPQGYKETREDTKEDTKKKQGDKSPRGKAPAFSPFSSLPEGEVKEALMDYVEVRKGGKSPIKTERQEKLLLKKLEELSGGDTAKKVKIIEAATMAGWKMFYPLKEDKETRPPARRSDVDPWQGRLIPPQ